MDREVRKSEREQGMQGIAQSEQKNDGGGERIGS